MIKSLSRKLHTAGYVALALPFFMVNVNAAQTMMSEAVSENVTVINAGSVKFHTYHGISNSHIIETTNELRLIDTQFNFKQAKDLKKYLDQLGKPLTTVILSHNHPDHWFGAEIFSTNAPVATSSNVMNDLKTGGKRYIKIMQKNPKMKGIMPSEVIVPSEELALGKQIWDGLEVVVEEYTEHESHHSLLIKVPAYGIMIGQDMFYNNMFLVASERERNKNWRAILEGFSNNEANQYKTLLVGHGKNGGPDILAQDIEYLDALEATLEKDLGMENTQEALIAQFPEKRGKGMLGISMRNLFSKH